MSLTGIFIVFAFFFSSSFCEIPKVKDLESFLNNALETDKPIHLVIGNSFESEPGTAIFVSREEGTRRMRALACSEEPELAMIFLPQWSVWITETTLRLSDETRIDTRYLEAAVLSGAEVEHWHTHTNFSEQRFGEEEKRKKLIQWTMPSPDDLLQLYVFYREIPEGKLTGVIASTHGITRYWNYEPGWAGAIYVRFAVRAEAHNLYMETRKLSVSQLSRFAQSHQGFIKLSFDRYPN